MLRTPYKYQNNSFPFIYTSFYYFLISSSKVGIDIGRWGVVATIPIELSWLVYKARGSWLTVMESLRQIPVKSKVQSKELGGSSDAEDKERGLLLRNQKGGKCCVGLDVSLQTSIDQKLLFTPGTDL